MSLTFSSDFDAFSWQTFQIHFPIHFYSVDLVAVKINYSKKPNFWSFTEPIFQAIQNSHKYFSRRFVLNPIRCGPFGAISRHSVVAALIKSKIPTLVKSFYTFFCNFYKNITVKIFSQPKKGRIFEENGQTPVTVPRKAASNVVKCFFFNPKNYFLGQVLLGLFEQKVCWKTSGSFSQIFCFNGTFFVGNKSWNSLVLD